MLWHCYCCFPFVMSYVLIFSFLSWSVSCSSVSIDVCFLLSWFWVIFMQCFSSVLVTILTVFQSYVTPVCVLQVDALESVMSVQHMSAVYCFCSWNVIKMLWRSYCITFISCQISLCWVELCFFFVFLYCLSFTVTCCNVSRQSFRGCLTVSFSRIKYSCCLIAVLVLYLQIDRNNETVLHLFSLLCFYL